MNKIRRIHVNYFVLFASITLLIYNIYVLGINNIGNASVSELVFNAGLIIAIVLTLFDMKKKRGNQVKS
jgi:hypothetical protein